jgi:ABC-type antimicrobial peptide transport system permease subunit
VRVPTLLERYSLSICSGYFNSWTRKVAATDERFSLMYTIEWEMPYFNMGSTFDYAEIPYLMIPRPFIIAGLAAVALLASWLPARRASRLAPTNALRREYRFFRQTSPHLMLGDDDR